VHGRERWFGDDFWITQKVWQFGVIVGVLGLGGLAIWRSRWHDHPKFEWVVWTPKLMVFTFCLGLLAFEPQIGIFAVWLITFAIATAVLRLAFTTRVIPGRQAPPDSGSPALNGTSSVGA
jgi:hypothetical protein